MIDAFNISISLLESLIEAVLLYECFDIEKKHFIAVDTLLVTIVKILCDTMFDEFWTLSALIVIVHLIIVSFYQRREWVYHLAMIVLNEELIILATFIVILLLTAINVSDFVYLIVGSILARLLQVFFSYIMVKEKRRYHQLDRRFWIPIIVCMMISTFYLITFAYMVVNKITTFTLAPLIIVQVLNFVFLLFYLENINQVAKEKEEVTRRNQNMKFQLISQDMMYYSMREIERFEHRFLYILDSIKNSVKEGHHDQTLKMIESHKEKIRLLDYIHTSNPVFDSIIGMKIKSIDHLNLVLEIKKDEFYDRYETIVFFEDLLNALPMNKPLTMHIYENEESCLIEMHSMESFFDDSVLLAIIKKTGMMAMHQRSTFDDMHTLMISLRK